MANSPVEKMPHLKGDLRVLAPQFKESKLKVGKMLRNSIWGEKCCKSLFFFKKSCKSYNGKSIN